MLPISILLLVALVAADSNCTFEKYDFIKDDLDLFTYTEAYSTDNYDSSYLYYVKICTPIDPSTISSTDCGCCAVTLQTADVVGIQMDNYDGKCRIIGLLPSPLGGLQTGW